MYKSAVPGRWVNCTRMGSRFSLDSALRAICTVFLIAGMTAVSIVDADGDPMTVNVPSAALVAEVNPATDVAETIASPERRLFSGLKKLTVFLRRQGEWLVTVGQRPWHPRVRPIRGP